MKVVTHTVGSGILRLDLKQALGGLEFLKRNTLVFRRATHISQIFGDEDRDRLNDFWLSD